MKKNKKTNKIVNAFYAIFGTLPLLITLYLYPVIPNKVPIHYRFDGVIDVWGNKNELLIVPIIILLFVILQAKLFKINFNYEPEDKVTRCNNYYFLIILNTLVYTTLYISINYETCLDRFSLYNFFSCSLCLFFAFIGNYIPSANRTSSFSIRNKFTLESEFIWKKSHKFCGSLWLSGGIVFFPMFLFSKGYILLIITIFMLVIFTMLPALYIYHLHRNYLKDSLIGKRKGIHNYN